MSDGILSRLRRRRWPSLTPSDDEARLMQIAYNQALDDVREALTNLSDEQVRDIARYWLNEHYQVYDTITGQFRCVCGDAGDRDAHRIRVMFATAAGGDQ